MCLLQFAGLSIACGCFSTGASGGFDVSSHIFNEGGIVAAALAISVRQ